jgi:uncharacterized membrane-anchored protein YhcB (DUF1043 family)
MNVEDKLQLIRAIEANEAAAARRSGVVAWTTVVAAGLVLAVMVGVASMRLADLNERAATAGRNIAAAEEKLGKAQEQLKAAEARLATVKAETDEALRKLQSVDRPGIVERSDDPQAVESAVDNLLAASAAAAPARPATGPRTGANRGDAIRQLFDPSGAVRVRAYGALLPLYANDPTLVPEILAVAREQPRNANGIYNALVVLTHMNAASLRPHRAEIVAFARDAQRLGPRVAERARTLVRRIPS